MASISGTSGNDILFGTTGSDIIEGGAGTDTLLGGGQNDIFVFSAQAHLQGQPDILADFGRDDIIDVSVLGLDAPTDASATVVIDGTTTAASVSAPGMLIFSGGRTDGYTSAATAYAAAIATFRQSGGTYGTAADQFLVWKNTANQAVLSVVRDSNSDGVAEEAFDVAVLAAWTPATLAAVGFTMAANVRTTPAGTAGNDVFSGTATNDVYDGGAGNDTITGNAGDDILAGGAGADSLTGGAGRDTFVFTRADLTGGPDTITDFTFVENGLRADSLSLIDFGIVKGGRVRTGVVLDNTYNGIYPYGAGSADLVILGTGQFNSNQDVYNRIVSIVVDERLYTIADGHFLVLWEDTSGVVTLTLMQDNAPGTSQFSAGTFVDLVRFEGLAMATVVQHANSGFLTVAPVEALLTFNANGTQAIKWANPTITYAMPTGWTQAQQASMEAAMQAWASVANITFQRTTDTTTAGIVFATAAESGVAFPDASFPGDAITRATISMASSFGAGGYTPGSDAFATALRLVGRALGLDVPAPYSGSQYGAGAGGLPHLPPVYDTTQYTILSENNAFGATVRTLGLWDIEAVQTLYGLRAFRGGDDRYGGGNTTGEAVFGTATTAPVAIIHDTGGIDTLDYSHMPTAMTLDLRPEHFSTIGGIAGLGIGATTVIENASGGVAGDTIRGNAYANVLRGNGGNDTLDGGRGIDTAVFSGNRADYLITSLAGRVTVAHRNGGIDGTDTLTNIERLQFADATLSLATPRTDLDGDGTEDLVWYNAAAGELSLWWSNGGRRQSITVGTGMDLVAVDDFSGDGLQDLLWYDRTNNRSRLWFFNEDGTYREGGTDFAAGSVAATGDFDGDGDADVIIWASSAGSAWAWTLDGGARTASRWVDPLTGGWHIAGTADFSKDGKDDVLLHNALTGEIKIWFMNGVTMTAQTRLDPLQTTYSLGGIHDFNGDGNPDLLWHDRYSGATYVWLMDGADRIGGYRLGTAASGYSVQAVGDYSDSLGADVLWVNPATGAASLWQLNDSGRLAGTASFETPGVGAVVDAHDQPRRRDAAQDLNGDGKTDLVWRDPLTDDIHVWLMDGNRRVASGVAGTIPGGFSIIAIEDVSNDGKADLVLRNDRWNSVVYWLMDGVTVVQEVNTGNGVYGRPLYGDTDGDGDIELMNTNNTTSGVTNIGVGDFNGDGRDDILQRNTSTGANAIRFSSVPVSSPVTLPTVSAGRDYAVAGIGDFDGDGNSDILWRHTSTGATYLWLMAGANKVGGGLIGTVGTHYTITTVGDFTGDGRADILWRNTATGAQTLWAMDGTRLVAATQAPRVDPTYGAEPYAQALRPEGPATLDFDANGYADMLWLNRASGQITAWTVIRETMIASRTLTPDAGWSVQGTGDFNGDGRTDILLRNGMTGEAIAWYMSGVQYAGKLELGAAGTAYTMAGLGDTNGDGRSDIVWHNSGTGAVYLWTVTASGRTGTPVGTAEQGFTVAAVADFTGDGKEDILWRNGTTGVNRLWTMDGNRVSAVTTVEGVSSSYALLGAGDVNGDGTADLAWRHDSTGAVVVWTLRDGVKDIGRTVGTAGADLTLAAFSDYNGDGKADLLWQDTAAGTTTLWTLNGPSLFRTYEGPAVSSSWQSLGALAS